MVTDKNQYGDSISILQAVMLVAAGLLSVHIPAIASAAWIATIVFSLYGAAVNEMKWVWYGFAASPSLEIWSRMARAPLIPHEIGKYYFLLIICILFINYARASEVKSQYHIGAMMLMCLLPSCIVAFGAFVFEDWVMNLLGILELSIIMIFSARERWPIEKFCRVLQFGLMPVIPVLAYLVLKTPDFAKIDFRLSSNFKTSGDFGSNQVSTILGLGMVLTMVLLILRKPLFRLKWLNYILLCVLLFRGFLTFSRGGVLSAIIGVLIALIPIALSSLRSFLKYTIVTLVFGGLAVFVFMKVNEVTGNQLLLRYQGETVGTLSGTKQRTLNTMTSYRLELAETDWLMFKDNPVFGVGPGASKDLRERYGFQAIASHTEYTRLLSEHGLGGLVVIFMMVLFPVWWISRQKYTLWRAAIGSLFVFALLTSLHSAMRTNTTVVCFVLASIPVYHFIHKPTETAEANA
ncbi:MAG: O-antigen ligase family protein [Bacteroidetes bacterium]|nr:O-antigen ligase family protein [Bacteroidota bacterium]